nr:phosphatase PAP2 family protein [Nostoc flagelliforme]
MLFITNLGNPNTVVVVAGITLLLLSWRRYREEAKLFVLACLGALILNTGLKLFFSKPRPELWHRLITEKSFSFPSGHALGSMVLYGFIAYEVATHYMVLLLTKWQLTILVLPKLFIVWRLF